MEHTCVLVPNPHHILFLLNGVEYTRAYKKFGVVARVPLYNTFSHLHSGGYIVRQ